MNTRGRKVKIGDIAREIIGSLIEGVGGFIFLAGACILAYQLFYWVLNTQWISFPLKFVLSFFPAVSWLEQPRMFHLLHETVMLVLERMPLTLFLTVTGYILIAIGENVK